MKELLEKVGFTQKEAEAYILLNKLGPTPASTLARLSGIQRTSIYDVLAKLQEKNLILSFKQGNTEYFVIDDIQKLCITAEEKLLITKEIIAKMALEQHIDTVDIKYYRGMSGLKEMYTNILNNLTQELLVWGHVEEFYKLIDPIFDQAWVQERVTKNIYCRQLLQYTPLGKEYQSKDPNCFRETRLLEEKYMFTGACFIYGDRVCLFDTSYQGVGIEFNNPIFATMHQQMFEIAWDYYPKIA